jgi:hypothetical protein
MMNGEPNRPDAGDILALDFDGVVCDSAAEGAVTSWRAGARLWPGWQGEGPPAVCVERFVRLRPVVETGYQMPLLMKLVYDGVSDAEILSRFLPLCEGLMAAGNLTRGALVELFGAARDRWIEGDLAGWLGRHRFYPGVIDRIKAALAVRPVYILTTKQERFTHQLLTSQGAAVPRERIWGLERNLSKPRLLALLMADPAHRWAQIHFVEDRLDTLLAVEKEPGLDPVRLYLAEWGYNTPDQREAARCHPRITLWPIDRFLAI